MKLFLNMSLFSLAMLGKGHGGLYKAPIKEEMLRGEEEKINFSHF